MVHVKSTVDDDADLRRRLNRTSLSVVRLRWRPAGSLELHVSVDIGIYPLAKQAVKLGRRVEKSPGDVALPHRRACCHSRATKVDTFHRKLCT